MIYIIVVAVLVLTCMTNAKPDIARTFFIHKSSYGTPCEKIDCFHQNGRVTCDTIWRANCLLKIETFVLGDEKDGFHPFIHRNGKQCDGKILKLEDKENISKFTISDESGTHILCGTHLKELSDEDKKHLEKVCPEKNLKKADHSHC